MVSKATLTNKAHPEYGQATIPLPIPDGEHDHTIELLEGVDIGPPPIGTAGWMGWIASTPPSTGW